MPRTPDLAVIILAVPDIAFAARFYEAAFGWEISVREAHYVEFVLPNGTRLGFYEREGFALHTAQVPLPVPGGQLAPLELYFHADDVDRAVAKLRDAGARQLAPLQLKEWGDEAAYFADPFGNVLVIARRLAGFQSEVRGSMR